MKMSARIVYWSYKAQCFSTSRTWYMNVISKHSWVTRIMRCTNTFCSKVHIKTKTNMYEFGGQVFHHRYFYVFGEALFDHSFTVAVQHTDRSLIANIVCTAMSVENCTDTMFENCWNGRLSREHFWGSAKGLVVHMPFYVVSFNANIYDHHPKSSYRKCCAANAHNTKLLGHSCSIIRAPTVWKLSDIKTAWWNNS